MISAAKIYQASNDNVKRASELFLDVMKSEKKRKSADDDYLKYSHYCTSVNNNTKKSTASTFSLSFTLNEMRLCLMKHDWINLQRLFPLLLELSSDKEILVWRYALIILLHSPMSSGIHIEEFLNLCVGCQNDNLSYILNQLISLNKTLY